MYRLTTTLTTKVKDAPVECKGSIQSSFHRFIEDTCTILHIESLDAEDSDSDGKMEDSDTGGSEVGSRGPGLIGGSLKTWLTRTTLYLSLDIWRDR